MSINVMIVGSSGPKFSGVLQRINETKRLKKAQALGAIELLERVKHVVTCTNQLIDTLDIYAEGGEGFLLLDQEKLFGSDGTGWLIAASLRPFLTTDARVRLLGCLTAEADGRALLSMLRQAFGGSVVVYGTNWSVSENDFDEGGFDQTQDTTLFSSTEAEAMPPPTKMAKQVEQARFLAAQRGRCSGPDAADANGKVDVAVGPLVSPVGVVGG